MALDEAAFEKSEDRVSGIEQQPGLLAVKLDFEQQIPLISNSFRWLVSMPARSANPSDNLSEATAFGKCSARFRAGRMPPGRHHAWTALCRDSRR